jgi:hypothetical protein
MRTPQRDLVVSCFAVCGILLSAEQSTRAADTKALFDIPSKVECQDVTPEKCAQMHPHMKVIEAKFRISAGFAEGGEATTEDFVYMITSPDLRLKVLDFLPNTTLESSTADDRIEVTDSTESGDALSGDTRVGYSVISLGGSKSTSSKKTASNHYERVAPKKLVLASGTVHRGYGVFYKLRPSAGVSLEGAKEFVLLCIVPKNWRGDWCTVTCSARAHKRTGAASSWTISGLEQAHVGLFLTGDQEASALADELTEIQLAHDGLLAKHLAKDAAHIMESMHTTSGWQHFKSSSGDLFKRISLIKGPHKDPALESSRLKLLDLEEQLTALSGKSASPR